MPENWCKPQTAKQKWPADKLGCRLAVCSILAAGPGAFIIPRPHDLSRWYFIILAVKDQSTAGIISFRNYQQRLFLCADRCVSFTVEHLQHIPVRIKIAGSCHREDAWVAAADQRYVLFVHLDGLLCISALNIPENQLGQFISAAAIQFPGIIEVGRIRILRTGVELHVGDDIQRFRELRLRQAVFNSRIQNQLKYLLDTPFLLRRL